MISEELLLDTFKKEVEDLGSAKGLSTIEKEKIIETFVNAMSDRFMDERKIYSLMIK